ncbi:MAG: hypothetical protein KGM98_02300 [Bacteroidota bacterium]|nr:hypothetical protein [Bacteroidota bacterium]
MTISGFTFVRNATKLYYPVRESIESILPIVDEFVVALGEGDPDDRTLEEIQKIGSQKIRIVTTRWDLKRYPGGSEYAHQTDIAKAHCTGDWLFYLQSDEVIHEKYLDTIQRTCKAYHYDSEVEGLLFDYRHFWGDYRHYLLSHAWYPREIRIIRNLKDIHSWRDAQSFRVIPDFDGKDYFQKINTYKLKVARVGACVYHYGWVRPPSLMQKKRVSFETHMQGADRASELFREAPPAFDYGDLSRLKVFHESHPAVMQDFIERFNWEQELSPDRKAIATHKHDRLKYRLLTFVEQHFLGGKQIAGFKNYQLVRKGLITQ